MTDERFQGEGNDGEEIAASRALLIYSMMCQSLPSLAPQELAALLRAAVKQPKLEAGVDPKSVLCEFFKAGVCEKGACPTFVTRFLEKPDAVTAYDRCGISPSREATLTPLSTMQSAILRRRQVQVQPRPHHRAQGGQGQHLRGQARHQGGGQDGGLGPGACRSKFLPRRPCNAPRCCIAFVERLFAFTPPSSTAFSSIVGFSLCARRPSWRAWSSPSTARRRGCPTRRRSCACTSWTRWRRSCTAGSGSAP